MQKWRVSSLVPRCLLNGFWGKEPRWHKTHLTCPRALTAQPHPPTLPWVGAYGHCTTDRPDAAKDTACTQKTHSKPFQDLSWVLEECLPCRVTSRLRGRLVHAETDAFSAEPRAVSCQRGRAESGQGSIGQAGLPHTSLHETQTGTRGQATAVPKPQWRIYMREGNQRQGGSWPEVEAEAVLASRQGAGAAGSMKVTRHTSFLPQ